jgi:glycosyltransferase involved in cell wall biosynthesis
VRTLPLKNVPLFVKGISNMILPMLYEKALNDHIKVNNFDLIIIPTPPITLVDLTLKLKKKFNSKIYLILRDIFPQNAIDLGLIKKNSLIHRYFRAKEKKLYKVADHIGCMSQGNIKYINDKNPFLKKEKLHELKNFQLQFKEYGYKNYELKRKYNIEKEFVVVFGGNMGKAQQLENVIELAVNCSGYNDVLFLIIGEGVMMKKIEDKIIRRNIKNIMIQKTIPKKEYQKLLSVCDLGLISLNENFTIPNIPSKTLDYFNVGVPVLASIDKATDYGLLLDEANAGLWSYAGDHKKLHENFHLLYINAELRSHLGKNGRSYFEKYLTPEIAFRTIIKEIS